MNNNKNIILATHNIGKYREFVHAFEHLPLQLISLEKFNFKLPQETGLTFVENALQKARAIALQSDLSVIADDSGLIVPYLKGQPGIYSARFSTPDPSDEKNITKLLEMCRGLSILQKSAYFYCVLVYLRYAEDPVPLILEGAWHGQIIDSPRGKNGFGYDPIFYVPSLNCTAAELSLEEKNKLSHRGQAVQKLKEYLSES